MPRKAFLSIKGFSPEISGSLITSVPKIISKGLYDRKSGKRPSADASNVTAPTNGKITEMVNLFSLTRFSRSIPLS
jgi:hypothetical protein